MLLLLCRDANLERRTVLFCGGPNWTSALLMLRRFEATGMRQSSLFPSLPFIASMLKLFGCLLKDI